MDPDQWEFANEEFIRGEKHLLKNIYRRKPIHSHSLQNIPLTNSEKQMYEYEIKRLLHENSFLHSELQGHGGENHAGIELHVQLLGKRLHEMDDKQTRLFRFLAELMRNPRFLSALTDQSDDQSGKRRRILELDELELNNNSKENGAIPVLDLSLVQKLDNSLNTWNSFLHWVGQRISEEENDIGSSSRPLAVVDTVIGESSGDSGRNINTWSPRSAPSYSSKDLRSISPELCPSLDQVESPTASSVHLNVDISLKSSVIDVNSKLSNNDRASEIEKNLREQVGEKIPGAPPEMNDVFWEQLLMEATPPSDPQEVQSERPMDVTNAVSQQWNVWWNSHYVTDSLKQVGTRTLDGTT